MIIAHQWHPDYPLIVLSNRDEFHERDAVAMHRWPNSNVVAGQDVRAGGTWLGAARQADVIQTDMLRFALITNYRDGERIAANRANKVQFASRGELVTQYLEDTVAPHEYAQHIALANYDGFNMLCWQQGQPLHYISNESPSLALGPGLYGVSNHLLDTPWPKLTRLKESFRDYMTGRDQSSPLVLDDLFALLRDDSKAAPELLPNTGISQPFETLLSSIFIASPAYGTRCSTIAVCDARGQFTLTERRYDASGSVSADDTHLTV